MGGINIFDLLWGQLVNVPVDNLLGTIYAIINAVMLIFATFFGFGQTE